MTISTLRLSNVAVVLLALNALGFAYTLWSGVSFLQPSVGDLIALGGNYAPRIAAGEWWRLFCAMFLHAGILHLFCNLAALYLAALILRFATEKQILVIYFVSGLVGSLVSLQANPFDVNVGASGAILGLYGSIISHALAGRRFTFNKEARLHLMLALPMLVGAMVPRSGGMKVDIACHLGGVLTGIFLGYMLSPRRRRIGFAFASGMIFAMSVVGVGALPKRPDLFAAMERVERQVKELQSLEFELRALPRATDLVSAARRSQFLEGRILPLTREILLGLEETQGLHDERAERALDATRLSVTSAFGKLNAIAVALRTAQQSYEMADAEVE